VLFTVTSPAFKKDGLLRAIGALWVRVLAGLMSSLTSRRHRQSRSSLDPQETRRAGRTSIKTGGARLGPLSSWSQRSPKLGRDPSRRSRVTAETKDLVRTGERADPRGSRCCEPWRLPAVRVDLAGAQSDANLARHIGRGSVPAKEEEECPSAVHPARNDDRSGARSILRRRRFTGASVIRVRGRRSSVSSRTRSCGGSGWVDADRLSARGSGVANGSHPSGGTATTRLDTAIAWNSRGIRLPSVDFVVAKMVRKLDAL
jgi:hypothetical protein